MVVREEKKITATLCVPIISTMVKNLEEYINIQKQLRESLIEYANDIIGDSEITLEIVVNSNMLNKIYMLSTGSCIECGEEGIVGRGNSSNGIIATFRPGTMEAPAGKNPRYHTGRVLGYVADRFSEKLYHDLGIKNQVLMVTQNQCSLVPPYYTFISLEDDVQIDNTEIEKIFNKEVAEFNYNLNILAQRNIK